MDALARRRQLQLRVSELDSALADVDAGSTDEASLARLLIAVNGAEAFRAQDDLDRLAAEVERVEHEVEARAAAARSAAGRDAHSDAAEMQRALAELRDMVRAGFALTVGTGQR